MPARRRCTTSRNPLQRLEMWDKKMEPTVYTQYLQTTKPLALPKVERYQVEHELLIETVKKALSTTPSEAPVIQQYMWFAEKLWKLSRTYTSEALQKEIDALYTWHLVRGANDQALRSVAEELGLKISSLDEIIVNRILPSKVVDEIITAILSGISSSVRDKRITKMNFTWNPDGTVNTITAYQQDQPLFTLTFTWNPDGTLQSITRTEPTS